MRTSSFSSSLPPQLSSFDVDSTMTSYSTSTSISSSSSTPTSNANATANSKGNLNNGDYTSYQLIMNMFQQKYQMVQQQTMMNQSHNKIYSQQQQLSSTASTGGTTPKSPSPITPLSAISSNSCSSSSDAAQVYHNLVILDWDDTCYPTTHFVARQHKPTAINLGLFGKYLYLFLNALIAQYGESNIYIITNAAKDWVYRSLRESSKKYQQQTGHDLQMKGQDYFAAIYNSLLTENIRIISAQDMFCKKYPNQPLLWKINAFKQITEQHFTVQTNPTSKTYTYCILSIGDSEDEFTASLEAKQVLNKQIKAIPPLSGNGNNHNNNQYDVILHRVKLADDPCIVQMMHQLHYLTNNIDVFVSTNTPITVRL